MTACSRVQGWPTIASNGQQWPARRAPWPSDCERTSLASSGQHSASESCSASDVRDAHMSVASELKGRLKECADCRPPMHPPPLHSYYNATTGQSSWEVPPEFRAMVNSAAAAAAPVGAAQQVSAPHCATALHCTAPPPHTRPLKAFGAFTITRCTCRACVPINRHHSMHLSRVCSY